MKRKYFKDGNPELYNFFTDQELKNFTPKEKAMWTPYSGVDQAPIPEEVIRFNEAQEIPSCNEDSKCKRLETEIIDLKAELAKSKKPVNLDIVADLKPKKPLTEEEKKKALIAQLKEKGIKATMNYKVETLQKKLADANNTE